MSINYNPKIVTDGLVLYLDAANIKSYPGSGNTITDLSGNSSMSLVNAPTFDSANGGSIVFDGVDDWISRTNSSAGPNIPGAITLAAWIKRVNTNSGLIISCNTQYGLFAGGQYWYYASNPNWVYAYTSVVVPQNSWVYLVLTHTPGSALQPIFYINGVPNTATGNTPNAAITGTTGVLYVGEYSNYRPYNPYRGKISQVQIYNRALSQSEIQQNFNATRSRYGV
jgi:hypothetical protein